MEEFSAISHSIAELEERIKVEAELKPVKPFTDDELAEEKRLERLARSKDFWFFDRQYFTPEMYSEGWSEPCPLHDLILACSQLPGVNIIFGPRSHGKTVTAKKIMVWKLLTGQVQVAGIYTEMLNPKAYNLLQDIKELIADNERIIYDYQPEFKQANNDQFQFRTLARGTIKKWRTVAAFSEGRSVRGYVKQFARPEFLLGDDVETVSSPMNLDSIQHRIDKIAESYQSLARAVGTFVILGNDFSEGSALHRLKIEQEHNILAPHWRVYSIPAYSDASSVIAGIKFPKGTLWKARYKARTELELKIELEAKDESDWQANFQQNPVPPSGFIFKREHYREYSTLPKDARGVMFTDPNLSKKSKGNTTAVAVLLFSPSELKYYVPAVKCRSYSDSNELLSDVVDLKAKIKGVVAIAFDGNVTQESVWSNNVRNWCKIHEVPYPRIEYKRYNVDELAKNLQLAWADDMILFPEGFIKTQEGNRFMMQLLGFQGKRANKLDDAAEALIGAFEFIHERSLVRRRENAKFVTFVHDTFF